MIKNYGLLPPIPDEKDYFQGGITGIVYEERNTLGDWFQFKPTDERQNYRNFDDSGCVSHSAENIAEMTFSWLLQNKLLSVEDMEWLNKNGYFDENGKVNFDDRWLVVLSGTKPGVGNYIKNVWDAIRKYGLVPQGTTPFKSMMSQKEYYDKSDFPFEAYLLGEDFLKRFIVQYERVGVDDASLKRALKQSPVQVGVATCSPWQTEEVIRYCGLPANHAIALVSIDSKGIKHIVDSYEPFTKDLEKGYKVDFAYKGVITPVNSVTGQKKKNYVFHKNLKFGDYDNDITELCKRLIEEDCMDGNIPPTPHYGVEVANGILNYWYKYNVVSWWEKLYYKGKLFGTKTRTHMNGGANV